MKTKPELWQIVLVDDLNGDYSDLSDQEIAELKGSRNTVFQGAQTDAVAYAREQLQTSAEEHNSQFHDDAVDNIAYEVNVNVNEDGIATVITAKVGGETYAEVTVYPVTVVTK